MPALDRLLIRGFKSIRGADLDLRSLNVLIGANGAGKSNLIAVFDLLHALVNERLQVYVGQAAGAESFLHFGRKTTTKIKLRFRFGQRAYECELVPTDDESLIFGDEWLLIYGKDHKKDEWLGSGHPETKLTSRIDQDAPCKSVAHVVSLAFKSWRAYHFHDTGRSAKVKQSGPIDDNEYLRENAENLAAFLYRLQQTSDNVYSNIVETVRLVMPFFGDFRLRPNPLKQGKIKLEWQERGSDSYFDAHALSDGTLRFICLATLLLQPEPPTTILLDEPELGLHPFAITVLSDLLRSAAQRTQVIASTQSVTLVNQFAPEDLLVVDREGGESKFRRLGEAEISSWLDDYSLGELWEKNILGGRPAG